MARPALARIWVAAAALCVGTAIGTSWTSDVVPLMVVAAGAALVPLRRRHGVVLAGLVLLAGGAGALNAQTRMTLRGGLTAIARDVPRCSVEAVAIENLGGLGSLLSVQDASCDGWRRLRRGVVAVSEPLAEPGSRLRAEGWLVPLGDDGFDSSRRRLGAEAALHVATSSVISAPTGAHGVAARVRAGLGRAVSRVDPRAGSLLRGLTIGDTTGLDRLTMERFRATGLSHVLAVSGSNVAIVLGAVLISLRRLPLRVRVIAGYGALALFVLVVGPDASVLRAGVMGGIVLACLLHGHRSEPLAALGVAVIGVVALRPAMVHAAGMHLSVAATAGIVLFGDRIAAGLPIRPQSLRMMLGATLAAQVAVAPVLVATFGELSLVAPVANALALPAVAPATVIGLGAGCAAVFAGPAGELAVRPVVPALVWILWVADHLGATGWAMVTIPKWAGWPGLLAVAWSGARVLRRPLVRDDAR